MGFREQINQRPALVFSIIIVVIAILWGARIWNKNSNASRPPLSSGKAAYTVDDGQSWFFDSDTKIPPFDHDGKPAVRVQLWTYDDQTLFPTIVMRYTEQAKQAFESGQVQQPQRRIITQGLEVKKALDPNARWLTSNEPEYFILLQKAPLRDSDQKIAHPYEPK